MITMKLKEIGKITTGKTPSKNIKNAFGNYISFLTPKDFNGQRYSNITERSLSIEGVENVYNYIVKGPSVSVTCIGSDMGKTIFNEKDIISNQQINSISEIDSNINPMYLYYLLYTKRKQLHFIGSAQGSTMPILNKSDFGNLEFSFPSRKEQDIIVAKINSFDSKIEINNKINTNLLELLNTQYKHFLSKYNLTKVKLGDLCDVSAGGDKPKKISKEKNNENTIPVYSNGAKNNGLYGYTNEAKIFKKAVTVSARGTIGYTVLRTEPFVPIVRLISLQSKGTISPEFLYLLVNNLPIQGYGSTQQQITVPYVKKIVVSIPSSDLIIKFQKEIGPLFNQIDKNKRENDQLTSIKNVLLNKLF